MECSALLAVAFMVSGIVVNNAVAGGECASLGGACDDGGWSGASKLDEIGDPNASHAQDSASSKWPAKSREMRWNMSASTESGAEEETASDATGNATERANENATENATEMAKAAATASRMRADAAKAPIIRSDDVRGMLQPIEAPPEGAILLDVSENSSIHIPGSIVIPYMQFDESAGVLKSAEEISGILGAAGVSRDDPVVIYGECLPCGGGPSVATFVYWMMKGLGHENVSVLDGTAEDWQASGRNVTSEAGVLSPKSYVPVQADNRTATYEEVSDGQVQIVDARTVQEFGISNIPGSISIPYESVLDGDRIRDETQLERIFMMLDRDRPVAVYTNTGMKASVVWFALDMMGYDPLLYSLRDWDSHQSPAKNGTEQ